MRSAAYYEAHSYCWPGDETRHVGIPVHTGLGDLVAHICGNCLDQVRRVRRGSDLWIREDEA